MVAARHGTTQRWSNRRVWLQRTQYSTTNHLALRARRTLPCTSEMLVSVTWISHRFRLHGVPRCKAPDGVVQRAYHVGTATTCGCIDACMNSCISQAKSCMRPACTHVERVCTRMCDTHACPNTCTHASMNRGIPHQRTPASSLNECTDMRAARRRMLGSARTDVFFVLLFLFT
jgi:hypothetical protein